VLLHKCIANNIITSGTGKIVEASTTTKRNRRSRIGDRRCNSRFTSNTDRQTNRHPVNTLSVPFTTFTWRRYSCVATGLWGAGRTGRHLLGAAKRRKTPKIKKKIHVKIQIVSFICVCVQEKQSVMASVYLSSAITILNRLSSFKNLRRKGGKFDHRPGRPNVLLRHWR